MKTSYIYDITLPYGQLLTETTGTHTTAYTYEKNANWLWRLLITVPEASDDVVDGVTAEDEATTIEDGTPSTEEIEISD